MDTLPNKEESLKPNHRISCKFVKHAFMQAKMGIKRIRKLHFIYFPRNSTVRRINASMSNTIGNAHIPMI